MKSDNLQIMKILYRLIVLFLLVACSTTNNLYDETFDNALIGQSEMQVYSRMGPPSRTEAVSGGGKILVYEFDSKGMFLTPYRSPIKYDASMNAVGEPQGWTLTFGEHLVANNPQYTIYDTKVSYFKVFLNKKGICTRYEQNMPREQLDIYHERFKHFSSNNAK